MAVVLLTVATAQAASIDLTPVGSPGELSDAGPAGSLAQLAAGAIALMAGGRRTGTVERI
ncbi:MAG TPA: hypothetical protein DD670_13860 [Planctomycetaceae bacterium]|nr:hypothetical protein [Planctomycetaceae bacterium]